MPSYKDKDAGTWYCKFYYIDYEGKRRQKWKGGFLLKRDADAFEAEFLSSAAFAPNMPFSAFLDLYRNDVDSRLRASTIQAREFKIKNLIIPHFGDKGVGEISALDVRRWQNELIERDLSQNYIRVTHGVLSAVFNHAIKFYGLRTNPCTLAGLPVKPNEQAKQMRFWTFEEYNRVISEVKDLKARTAISLLYWSGMRKGELLALTWSALDLENRACDISKSYQRIRGKAVITPTKTGEQREILLPVVCVDQLKEYRAATYSPDPEAHVFPWEKRFIEQGIMDGASASGVKRIHVHGLRHSHASLLISQGSNIVLISKRLGHSKISTTLDTYSHFFPDDERKAVEDLDALVGVKK